MRASNEKKLSVLENASLRLEFDAAAGELRAVRNKLTGETYAVAGDAFAVETTGLRRAQADMRMAEWVLSAGKVSARFVDPAMTVDVVYGLRPEAAFFEKKLAVTFTTDAGVTRVLVSRPLFSAAGLQVVGYRHPDFDWIIEYVKVKHGSALWRPPDSEPTRTFFGRTPLGGFFTGLEMPFDSARLEEGRLVLDYTPSLKVKAGERLACEAMYFGVYRRSADDARVSDWASVSPVVLTGGVVGGGFDGGAAAGLDGGRKAESTVSAAKTIPLPSESRAMTAMASTVLGPPRHGVTAYACAWHCQMEKEAYDSDEKLAAEMKSLEVLAACGLDGFTDSHPWGGESAKMAALREGDRYVLDARVRRFLERARELGLKVTQWPTMNNTHPWRKYGGPFRTDHPEWMRGVEGEAHVGRDVNAFRQRLANCFACAPFYDWLERIILDDALGTGLYDSWCMDGDFWGTGAYYHNILPVTCTAANHDHLPMDANYACQRRLEELIARVRQRRPDIYIIMCRPPMDLGVWAQRNVDACFTLLESGTAGSNITAGNEVRTASRIRVHHHFFPHWIDQGLLFPSYAGPSGGPPWPSEHIDFLMLSALSSSPNLLLYLPTKKGIPDADKAEIRKWLDWGRTNAGYLLVRHDLFDWPAKGVVDGSAHLRGNSGLIFLFNGGKADLTGEFALTAESTGFAGNSPVVIEQEYPPCPRRETHRAGDVVRWPAPAETAVVLRISPAAV